MSLRPSRMRLAAVVLLLIIPILFLGFQFFKQSQKDIAFAHKELDGLRYLEATTSIIFSLTKSEKTGSMPQFKMLASELDKQMSSKSESENLLRLLSQKEAPAAEIITAAKNLSIKIGDQSNLILDPDLDSYYLMDAALLRLPEIAVLSHAAITKLNREGSSYRFTPNEVAQLQLLVGQISAAQEGLDHSFESAALGNADGSLRIKLEASSTEYSNQLDSFLYALQEEISSNASADLMVATTKSASDQHVQLNTATKHLWQDTASELKVLLEKRVYNLTTVRNLSLGLSALVAIVALLIAVGVFRSMLLRLDHKIVHLAHHDGLTGLPNRVNFMEQAQKALDAAKEKSENFAVFFVDMDRFKSLNDQYGHGAGDTVIKLAAERITTVVAPSGIVSRLGGDEFVVAISGIKGETKTKLISDRIVNLLSKPYELGSRSYQGTASVGVSRAPEQGYELSELLKTADMALYAAKANGRNQSMHFTEDMRIAATSRNLIEEQIREALRTNSFTLDYQPLYSDHGKKLSGFEALLRLKDINGKSISPAVLIPVAEQSRLIVEIGRWVIARACKTAANWPSNLSVAVNISPIELEYGTVANTIAKALAESGLKPNRLEVEITETALLDPTPQVLDQINRIHQMGVRIAVDDFGAGYSSFGYLWRLPFSKLKIDRSLTVALGASDSAVNIVFQSIVNMCRGLNIKVTAEGVENTEQKSTIVDFGCEELQGYLLGRPMPEINLASFILNEWKGPALLVSAPNEEQLQA